MTGTVTLYFNTGFNGVDIPASSAVLANATQKTYPQTYYVREDVDKPVIRVNDTYENVCDVDYCKIATNNKTCYYFVSAVEVLSKGVIALYLDLDALLTMGGAANLNYTSGWQERGHIAKSDDTLFGNVAAEDWRPSQPLHHVNAYEVEPGPNYHAQVDADVLVSNIELGELGADQNALNQQSVLEGVDSGGDVQMYFPMIPACDGATEFIMHDFGNNNNMSFQIPSTEAYNAKHTYVKRGIQKLYSCGQLALQGSYKIPKEWLAPSITGEPSGTANPMAGSHGEIQKIEGAHADMVMSQLPFEYTEGGYTPKNKKVFATYRDYTLAAIASGDMCIKSADQLYDTNYPASAPTLWVWADPASTGKPYARWSYMKGTNSLPFAECVKGLQWSSSQMVLEGASGSMWNSISTAFANQSAERAQSQNTFNLSGTIGQGALRAANMAVDAGVSQAKGVTGIIGALMDVSNLDNLAGRFGGMLGKAGVDSKGNATFTPSDAGSRSALGLANQGIDMIGSAMQMENNLKSLNLEMAQAKGNARFADSALQQQINENGINLLKSNNVVAPSVSFTPEQNLGLYGRNRFVVWETRKTLDDLKSEDKYYQRYGYNGIHRPLTSQCFNERDYYCFVQAFDINLKGAGSWGLRVRMKAINQLNSGVRVWKVLPDPSYYELN